MSGNRRPDDVLLTDKAACDASLNLVKNKCRSLEGKSVDGEIRSCSTSLSSRKDSESEFLSPTQTYDSASWKLEGV